MRYFKVNDPIFIFTDGHKTGLGAMLCQGKNQESARPVAVASRATSKAESNHPLTGFGGNGRRFCAT